MNTALKQTAFNDALEELGLNKGAGSDGKLPISRTRNRFTRQAETAGCTKVLDQWKSFNSSAAKAVPGKYTEFVLHFFILNFQGSVMTLMRRRWTTQLPHSIISIQS